MERIETPYYLNELRKHTSKVLEFEKTTVENIQLQLGETIPEHKTDADVVVIVRSGRVTFTAGGKPVELTAQHLLYLEPGEVHDVKAEEVTDLIVMHIKR